MSGEKAIGVAILGCGKMGQNVLSTLQNSPRVRAITVFDRNPGRMEELKTKFGVKSASTLDDVLKDPAIKLVLVTASNNAHRELTVAALEAGKAVMCEKPMATSVKACQNMIDACKAADKKLMVAYRIQFEPHNRLAMQWARDQKYGKVKFIELHNSQNIGDLAQ